MAETFFQMIFANDLRFGKTKVIRVLEYIKCEIPKIDDEDLYDLRVIYTELITNAIIHGNKLDFTKKVELFIEIDYNIIKSVVRDEGIGFDYTRLLKPVKKNCASFEEHGRGLKLVLGLTDFVRWNDKGNEVLFHKKVTC